MLNANEDEVYVSFKNKETRINDVFWNNLQKLIKQDIKNQIVRINIFQYFYSIIHKLLRTFKY